MSKQRHMQTRGVEGTRAETEHGEWHRICIIAYFTHCVCTQTLRVRERGIRLAASIVLHALVLGIRHPKFYFQPKIRYGRVILSGFTN